MSLNSFLKGCIQGPGIEFVSMTEELTRFRQQLEADAGGMPLHVLELNAADLLSDLCVFLRLGERQQEKILGAHNVVYLQALQSLSVKPTVMH